MAKNKISEWSSTAANNTDVGGIDIAEGCAPSGINNAIRELMAQVKDMQTGADSDNQVVGGNLTVNGNTVLGDSSADTLTINATTTFGVAVPITSGGTGATTAGAALTNLGAYPLATNPSNYTTLAAVAAVGYATGGGVATGTNTGDQTNISGNAGTATKLSTATGSAPSYSVRAFAVWDGSAAGTVLSSGNVSSITDNGTGLATINFTTAMPDTYYSMSGCALRTADSVTIQFGSAPLVGSVLTRMYAGSGGTLGDFTYTNVTITR